jgi:hypothetical protein
VSGLGPILGSGRVFSVCGSQRARSLAAMRAKHPSLTVDRGRVCAVVIREVGGSRPVWEGRQRLDGGIDADDASAQVQAVGRRERRADARLRRCCRWCSPPNPCGLRTRAADDRQRAAGTALEHLAATDDRPRSSRLRDEIVAELMTVNQSIQFHLEAIQKAPSGTRSRPTSFQAPPERVK